MTRRRAQSDNRNSHRIQIWQHPRPLLFPSLEGVRNRNFLRGNALSLISSLQGVEWHVGSLCIGYIQTVVSSAVSHVASTRPRSWKTPLYTRSNLLIGTIAAQQSYNCTWRCWRGRRPHCHTHTQRINSSLCLQISSVEFIRPHITPNYAFTSIPTVKTNGVGLVWRRLTLTDEQTTRLLNGDMAHNVAHLKISACC